MATAQTGGAYSTFTDKGIISEFYAALEDELERSWATQIAMQIPSDQETETYKFIGHVPPPREWLGGRHAKRLNIASFTITNKIYEQTLAFNVEDRRRQSKYRQLEIRIGEMAARFARHWESLITTLIEDNGTAYDSQSFFDTDHSFGDSGTLVNAVTNSHVAALDVTTATNPTSAEMALALLGVISYMYTYKDDQGEPMNQGARDFVAMVHPGIYGATLNAIFGQRLGGGDTSPLVPQEFNITPVPNPRLTSTADVFYVFRADGRAAPFIMQEEQGVQASLIAEGSEHEFKHNEHLLGAKAVRNAGYGLWEYAVKATLS